VAVKHEIPHDLEMDMAKAVARKAVESYQERFSSFDLVANWSGGTKVDLAFNVKGKKLDGSLSVLTNKFIFEMSVPFVFKVFTGQATKIIDRETRAWIAKAKAGEITADA
jgi:hypothetical protein